MDRTALRLFPGDVLGIVGESGSGKSTLALAMCGAIKAGLVARSGSVRIDELDLLRASARQLNDVRRREISYVPQNAGLALTPTRSIGALIREVLRFRIRGDVRRLNAIAQSLLNSLGLDGEAVISRHPHELSGGQQQRSALALALAAKPRILILDEPTAGVDASAQEAILHLLRNFATKEGVAIVCITHDLRVAASLCTRLAVMYAGRIVEDGRSSSLLASPKHPYTRALLAALPRMDERVLPEVIEGQAPSTNERISGCAFAERCVRATAECRNAEPAQATFLEGSLLCHHPWGRHLQKPKSAARAEQRVEIPCSPLLTISQVCVDIRSGRPIGDRAYRASKRGSKRLLDSVDLSVNRGETLGIVGESGSGKSTLLKVMAGVIAPSVGELRIDDRLCPDRALELRRRVQLVWQNAAAALNPRQTVLQAISAPLRLYFRMNGEQCRRKSIELLELVRLPSDYLDRLPLHLSGGEAQRVAIARACAAGPDLLLCDEITSALDVSVQAAVLKLIDDVRSETGCAIVFVSHDMAVIRSIADRVAVIKDGVICEIGRSEDLFERPQHPYSKTLIPVARLMPWSETTDNGRERLSAS
ncbi:ABC transporter ATP-binding protein [Mesorhizobium onobrychidis]|uniref:ABC transporter ATP-binding protein n=1 Tax=Mesorhizobium onobrychidis TaxID=2775404 RepID=A0ABY5QWV5_9HYPH|nr:ABC transporter ATP-binding protein [Mesorhizobium onobrychidis]